MRQTRQMTLQFCKAAVGQTQVRHRAVDQPVQRRFGRTGQAAYRIMIARTGDQGGMRKAVQVKRAVRAGLLRQMQPPCRHRAKIRGQTPARMRRKARIEAFAQQ